MWDWAGYVRAPSTCYSCACLAEGHASQRGGAQLTPSVRLLLLLPDV